MSLDLTVPIVNPVNVVELSSTSAVTLQRMLRQPNLLPVKIDEVVGEMRRPKNEGNLIPKALYLVSVKDEKGSEVELIVMDEVFEISEICPEANGILCLSIRGAAEAPLKAAFAAAIAISIASLQNTCVYDDAQNWTNEASVKPEALFNRMSVQRASGDLRSAAIDSCKLMNNPIS
jgi:hypothetical protein